MIKIQLSKAKKEKIEKIFLEDLVDGTTRDKCGKKRGKLIEALDTDECRNLLWHDNPSLYWYFYDKKGKLCVENVKKLLLADRKRMEKFIEQFKPYTDSKRANALLKTAFPYTNFSNRNVVNKILMEMEAPVCPYCNRLYTTVLKGKKVRPQLDHFFPKSRYPYLALCLYNLIPSCSVCNQAKSNWDTRKDPLLYPYEDEFGKEIVFSFDLKGQSDFVQKMQGNLSQIQVKILNPVPTSDLGKKVEQQDERLHLTDLYNTHGDYIADILKSYHINTEARVSELLQCFPTLFSSRDEVWNLLLMNRISQDQWSKRPLAKLTHDICIELENLKL